MADTAPASEPVDQYFQCPLCSDDWFASVAEFKDVVLWLTIEMPEQAPDLFGYQLQLGDKPGAELGPCVHCGKPVELCSVSEGDTFEMCCDECQHPIPRCEAPCERAKGHPGKHRASLRW